MGRTIHVVDDDASYRGAVARLLSMSGFNVASYESGDQLLAKLPGAEPGCILLDLQMPGIHGLNLQHKIAELAPLLPVVFLTGQGDIGTGVGAMKAGAVDFLEKPASGSSLLAAIERALNQYDNKLAEQQRRHLLQTLVDSLTPREAEVFAMVVHGHLNKQIAHALGTSERTVKVHRHRVMEKLKVRSWAEAVSLAGHIGLID
jgi:RNA polymerase sigma factor (sigma-70 family)